VISGAIRGALRSLLNHLLYRRFGDALHRNFDRPLDSIVKLHVQLLAHNRHFFGDRRFGALAHRLIEVFLDLRHHFGHLPRDRSLRVGRGNWSGRWRRDRWWARPWWRGRRDRRRRWRRIEQERRRDRRRSGGRQVDSEIAECRFQIADYRLNGWLNLK